MSDLLPGINHIDLHEGRLTGPFDLLRSDMTQIRLGGRIMLCVVADVVPPLNIVETKDGDIKAKWTIKPIDVAFVRDKTMQDHLTQALHMIGVDGYDEDDYEPPTGTTLVGQYDDEGAFVGMAPEVDLENEPVLGEEEDEEEPLLADDEEEEPVRQPLFQGRNKPAAPPASTSEVVESYGRPVERKDKHLSSFLDERVPA